MIETIIIEHLKSVLDVDVFMERPEHPPASYVIIEKTGGVKNNNISASTFAFQSYAPKLYDAASLNETVKEAVESLMDLDEIGRVSLNSDYNFTDTVTKQYRYQAIFVITHY